MMKAPDPGSGALHLAAQPPRIFDDKFQDRVGGCTGGRAAGDPPPHGCSAPLPYGATWSMRGRRVRVDLPVADGVGLLRSTVSQPFPCRGVQAVERDGRVSRRGRFAWTAALAAGRVEDTINLLGHAARGIVRIGSRGIGRGRRCRPAGLLLAPSIRRGSTSTGAIRRRSLRQLRPSSGGGELQRWVGGRLDDVVESPPFPARSDQHGIASIIRQGVAPARRDLGPPGSRTRACLRGHAPQGVGASPPRLSWKTSACAAGRGAHRRLR